MIKLSQRGFFGKAISRKHGQKCCPWGQNGKPLRRETVEDWIESYNSGLDEKHREERKWIVDDERTRLERMFYVQNIFRAVDFIQDLYNVDSETTRQIPSVHIEDQSVLRIELHTPQLKGLSYKDFQLANLIDQLDYEKYLLTPLSSKKGVRRVERQMKIDAQAQEFQDEIAATAKRFGSSKFSATDYEKSVGP